MAKVVRFSSFTNTRKFLNCSKLETGYISSSWGQNIAVAVDKIVVVEEVDITEKQKSNLNKTQDSKKKLEEFNAKLAESKALPELAETATDEEKTVRKLTVDKINLAIDTIISALYSNSGASEEANKYYLMAKNLKDGKDEKIEISYKDKPVMFKVEIAMVNNKYKFEIEFVSEEDKAMFYKML